MQQEIQVLEGNKTWDISDLPPDKKGLRCKWVYEIRYNPDGTVEQCKARLVILGNDQAEGVNFMRTFSPMAKLVTIRVFLVVAAA